MATPPSTFRIVQEHTGLHSKRITSFDGAEVKRKTFLTSTQSHSTPLAPRSSQGLEEIKPTISHTSTIPSSPSTITSSIGPGHHRSSSEAYMRRRKMNKVVQILGEVVPPELVFPAVPAEFLMLEFVTELMNTRDTPAVDNKAKKRRSREPVSTLAASLLLHGSSKGFAPPRPVIATQKPDTSLFPFRAAMIKPISEANGKQPIRPIRRKTIPAVSPPPTVTSRPDAVVASRPYTAPLQETNAPSPTSSPAVMASKSHASDSNDPDSSLSQIQPYFFDTESRETAASIGKFLGRDRTSGRRSTDIQGMEGIRRSVTRQESAQGWSGEWNRDDMRHVVNHLRRLK